MCLHKNVIDLDDFKEKRDAHTARRNSLERELARLDDQKRSLEQARIETASLMEYCERVRSNLRRFTIAEKRLALDALNIVATWNPGEPLEIQGSIPVCIPSNSTTYI